MGPTPLACAALLPDLVAAAASLAWTAPYGAEGLDWFAGMEEDDAAANRLLLTDPQAARAKTDKDRDEARATSASELAQALESFLSPVDAAALNEEMAEYLTTATMKDSRRAARDGGTTRAPMSAPGGSSCPISPFPCCCCTAGRTSSFPSRMANGSLPISPGPTAWLPDNDGHLTLVAHRVGEVHAWLSERL